MGKSSPKSVEKHMHGFDFEHHSQPLVISITQSTEMGTVYSADEIRELAVFTHDHGMLLHMDGARIANAAVHSICRSDHSQLMQESDIFSFGGTKNGMMYGEAVCFLKSGLSGGFKYITEAKHAACI